MPDVPVFPLPNVVLFPQTVLPLHIFEPRYREMTERALEGDRLIAMALLRPGWEADYGGNPAIHDVVGVGRIMNEQRISDGRFNLLLYGVHRARVVEVVSDQPYRTARVEVLSDRLDEKRREELEAKRQGLLSVYTSIVREVVKNEALMPDGDIPLGALCDVLAAFTDADASEKQAVLEELDVAARAERVVSLLQTSSVAGRVSRRGRGWPPEPRMN